jgi:DNA-binding NarL/FixJ family response regulator
VPSQPSPPAGRTRILIADDDRRFSERLRVSLEAHEAFQVVGIAATGDEALHLVETLKPSLVLKRLLFPVSTASRRRTECAGYPTGRPSCS